MGVYGSIFNIYYINVENYEWCWNRVYKSINAMLENIIVLGKLEEKAPE